MMQRIFWFFLLIGIVVVAVLLGWNSDMVTVKLPLVPDRELPLSVLLLMVSAIGFVFGSIMTGWMLRSRRKAAVAKAKEKAKQEKAEAKTDDSPLVETSV